MQLSAAAVTKTKTTKKRGATTPGVAVKGKTFAEKIKDIFGNVAKKPNRKG